MIQIIVVNIASVDKFLVSKIYEKDRRQQKKSWELKNSPVAQEKKGEKIFSHTVSKILQLAAHVSRDKNG